MGVGVDVDHHGLCRLGIGQRDEQHDEVEQVVQEFEGVGHGEGREVDVGGGGHVAVTEDDEGQGVTCRQEDEGQCVTCTDMTMRDRVLHVQT